MTTPRGRTAAFANPKQAAVDCYHKGHPTEEVSERPVGRMRDDDADNATDDGEDDDATGRPKAAQKSSGAENLRVSIGDK